MFAWSVSVLGSKLRKTVQILWGVLTNSYIKGFMSGSIYKGPLKHFCVPGMNCYSCPGALGACPIGALQAVLNSRQRRFPLYVLGFLMSIGLFLGRFVCGWLCVFGLIQELLYKIPTPKLKIPERADRIMRYFKYVVLVVFVIAIPLLYRSEFGAAVPFFCEYICPVGTLEGGIPLVLLNDQLRHSLGGLFILKMSILAVCILASVFIYRPFCKYLCPLGAFYALFQKTSLIRLKVDTSSCINCGACAKACGMNVDPSKIPNSAECIRCGECIRSCPKKALSFTSANKDKRS